MPHFGAHTETQAGGYCKTASFAVLAPLIRGRGQPPSKPGRALEWTIRAPRAMLALDGTTRADPAGV